MVFIIKGTIPRGPHHFLYEVGTEYEYFAQALDTSNEVQWKPILRPRQRQTKSWGNEKMVFVFGLVWFGFVCLFCFVLFCLI